MIYPQSSARGRGERKRIVNRASPLPMTRQSAVLALSRSSNDSRLQPTPEEGLTLMRRIEEIHLKLPFVGSRKIRDRLQRSGAGSPGRRVGV